MQESGSEIRRLGKRALIVTGPHVGKSESMMQLCQVLKAQDIEMCIFDAITAEPTVTMVEQGVAEYHRGDCDMVIGFGGGSPLDAAKAIAAMTVNEGVISQYVGKEIGGDLPPVVCIPTTAGTGSEVTKFSIITDEQTGVKMFLKGDALTPRLAIVDYTLSMTMPASVTAATGLDALTHAMEAYLSVKSQPLINVLAINSIKHILKNLPIAYADPDNRRAREQMALAALEAGICINNSSVTVVHGMSRPVGALFHVPHGLSNAMLLSVCLRDLYRSVGSDFDKIARKLKLIDGMELIEQVSALIETCNVPTPREYGIDPQQWESAIAKMSADAIASGSPANAPREYDEEKIAALYRKVYG